MLLLVSQPFFPDNLTASLQQISFWFIHRPTSEKDLTLFSIIYSNMITLPPLLWGGRSSLSLPIEMQTARGHSFATSKAGEGANKVKGLRGEKKTHMIFQELVFCRVFFFFLQDDPNIRNMNVFVGFT